MTDKRHQILLAALAIADAEGLAAVSMRSVAERVGVSAMALYPHVGSKDALLNGMMDVLLSELPAALDGLPAHDPWARLAALGQALRALAHRHPSTFALLLARPSVTPDGVRAVDAVYRALLDAGVAAAQVPRLERMFSTFVLGFAASEVNGRFSTHDNPRARRAEFAGGETLAHHLLAEQLGQPVDWDAEFTADMADLRTIIEAHLESPAGARRPVR